MCLCCAFTEPRPKSEGGVRCRRLTGCCSAAGASSEGGGQGPAHLTPPFRPHIPGGRLRSHRWGRQRALPHRTPNRIPCRTHHSGVGPWRGVPAGLCTCNGSRPCHSTFFHTQQTYMTFFKTSRYQHGSIVIAVCPQETMRGCPRQARRSWREQ